MQTFLDFITAGKYLPAVGVVLIALVGAARAGLGVHVPFFRTKLGGYALGYGAAFLLYVGTSLEAGNGITFAILANAIAAGWASAGGWEHALDIVNALRGKGDSGEKPAELPKAVAISGTVASLAIVALVFSASGCKSFAPIADDGKQIVIDCAKLQASDLETAAMSYVAQVLSGVQWASIEARAKTDAKSTGINFAGCALAEAVQFFNGGRKAVSVADSHAASDALEDYRATVAGGASFKFGEDTYR